MKDEVDARSGDETCGLFVKVTLGKTQEINNAGNTTDLSEQCRRYHLFVK